MKKSSRQEAHIKERVKKAAAVVGEILRIGRKRFGRD